MNGIARGKAQDAQVENVRFHVSTLEDWSDDEGPYQMIMAHSILHLIKDLDATLQHVRGRLKPGDWFVSSTVCVSDRSKMLGWVLPIIAKTKLIPRVAALTSANLEHRIVRAGFELEDVWRPGPGKAVFIIARAI